MGKCVENLRKARPSQRSEEKELVGQTGGAAEEEENKVSVAPGKPKRNHLEREWSTSVNAPENSSKRERQRQMTGFGRTKVLGDSGKNDFIK